MPVTKRFKSVQRENAEARQAEARLAYRRLLKHAGSLRHMVDSCSVPLKELTKATKDLESFARLVSEDCIIVPRRGEDR